MARAHHQAALGEQQRRAERVLVGAEQRRDDDVAAGLEAAVDAQPHAAAQAVRDERLLRLGEPELPGSAGVLDRRQRARAGAAVGAGDVDRRRRCAFATPAATSPTPVSATSFTEIARRGFTCAQVEDQLREILDRVDVVVRRRRDQRDAGLRVAQPRDLLGHLVRRELAALAGLRALRDLDLQLVGERGYSAVTPKRPDATCLILELRSVRKRAGSSPPSPQFERAPKTVERDRTSRAPPARARRATSPPPENRRTIASAGSTSSSRSRRSCRRFSGGGDVARLALAEAHETMAIALNRSRRRSNCGEGGEDPARYRHRAQLEDQADRVSAASASPPHTSRTPTSCRSRSRRARSPAKAARSRRTR